MVQSSLDHDGSLGGRVWVGMQHLCARCPMIGDMWTSMPTGVLIDATSASLGLWSGRKPRQIRDWTAARTSLLASDCDIPNKLTKRLCYHSLNQSKSRYSSSATLLRDSCYGINIA
jgi:hypothetical protein